MGKDLKGKELGKGISQRKDGRYQARFTDRFGNRRCVYGKTLKEVKNALMTEVVDDYSKNNVANPNITLDQWYEKWIRVYKEPVVKKNTLRGYKYLYQEYIKEELGDKPISNINKLMIVELFNKLGEKFRKRTVLNCYSLIAGIFKSAVENDLCNKNPVNGIKPFGLEKKEIVTLSRKDQRDFFNEAKGSIYYNSFVVAVNTGLRSGELRALTLDDIDFENNLIHVNKTLTYFAKSTLDDEFGINVSTPKTKTSIRTIPMNEACKKAIQDQIIQNKHLPPAGYSIKDLGELLFTTRKNTPILPRTYGSAIHSVIKKVNKVRMYYNQESMPLFNSHTFRHTFATRCFEAGLPPKTIQNILGHTTLEITMNIYTSVFEEKKQEDIKLLEKIMKDIVDF